MGKSQQINVKCTEFTFSSWAALHEDVSRFDESEIFSPFSVREGHKSQTRLIFRNTYGDAFNVSTLGCFRGGVELLITS